MTKIQIAQFLIHAFAFTWLIIDGYDIGYKVYNISQLLSRFCLVMNGYALVSICHLWISYSFLDSHYSAKYGYIFRFRQN